MKEKKILCGLDIGTNSVGWCLTDENNEIVKRQRKALWGVRMFEEAKPAASRRLARGQRRRYNRRKERIDLLRSMFEKAIGEKDPSFFYRLDNSFFQNEDRQTPFKYTLFNDRDYTDKDYYKEYPTIYHLRKHLVETEEKADIRLIYLAFHHMIKYRGNFLYPGSEFKAMDKGDAENFFNELNEVLKEYEHNELSFSAKKFEELKEINKTVFKLSEKKEQFNKILLINNDAFDKDVIIPLICGATISVTKIDKDIELDIKNLCVKSETYETDVAQIIDNYPEYEDLCQGLLACKKIHDLFLLGKMLGDDKLLCDAMVNKYNQHKEDLKQLKSYVKKYCPENYNAIFRTSGLKGKEKDKDKTVNYSKYIGSVNSNNEKSRTSHGSRDEFYSFLKKILEIKDIDIVSNEQKKAYESIRSKIDAETFLSLTNSTDNGVFPYQLNEEELKRIIENQYKYYPFLKEKDKDGYYIYKKIYSLLKYRIPYYVGPLVSAKRSENDRKFAWVKRTEEKIYPWNFDKVVDKDESAQRFIRRMQNKCTYLYSCYCLPKSSIIFSYYNVLSYLNKTLINSAYISYNEKKQIIKELFTTKRKVTKKDLEAYYKSHFGEDVKITTSTGKETEELTCDMASFYDFSQIFGRDFIEPNIDLIERLILDITIFEDKSIFEQRLRKVYGIKDEKIIKRIKALNYSKYGRISKELLTELISIDKDGEVHGSIITIMENTNQNLQEIIYDEKYGFQDLIREYNKEHSPSTQKDAIEDLVDDLYVSPGMKRALIQTYKIIDELEKIIQRPIDEFYVECTRSNKQEKTRSKSRYQKLKEIYANAKNVMKDDIEIKRMSHDLDTKKDSQNDFKSDKYYLYFLQMGRCMYSGEPIDLEDLYDDSKYQIDHIIPQSLVKDDSITNRVLVKSSKNQDKGDTYPIRQSLLFNGNYNAAYAFYGQLKKAGLMNAEKYARLMRYGELTSTELAGFVNRQLVFTSQAVKGVVKAIEYFKFSDTFKPRIVYSKGENVSDFRQRYDIVKSRTANNFHHAHDAYLNIVVGRTIDTYFSSFGKGPDLIRKIHEQHSTTNPDKIFENNKARTKLPVKDSQGNIVWNYEESIAKVKHNIFERFDILTTRRTFFGNELLSKVTILPKGEGTAPIRTTESDPLSKVNSYGGFAGYSFNSYALVEVTNKKNSKDNIIQAIPAPYFGKEKEYLEDLYPGCTIIIPQLKINTVIKEDKRKYCITGKTGKQYLLLNLLERRFNIEDVKIIKKIDKLMGLLEKNKNFVSSTEEHSADKLEISPASNNKTKAINITNEELIHLYDLLIATYQKEIYSYSIIKSLCEKLILKKNNFKELSILDRCKVVNNILLLLKCNERKAADLTLLNEMSKSEGILLHPSTFSNCSIVFESITGFYSHEYHIGDKK